MYVYLFIFFIFGIKWVEFVISLKFNLRFGLMISLVYLVLKMKEINKYMYVILRSIDKG